MNREEFIAFMDNVYEVIKAINLSKGEDYSGSEDAFLNFKRNADRLGMDKYQVWAIYAFKHLDAIETWLRDRTLKSEPIEGRIDDLILYLFLLRGMLAEDAQKNKN